jgi:hypothetical protein
LERINTAVDVYQILRLHFIFISCLLLQEVLFNLLEQGFSVVTGLHGESALLQRQTLSDRSFEYTLLFELTHCLSKMIWLSRQRLQAFLLVLKCFAGRTAANITYEHLLHLTW